MVAVGNGRCHGENGGGADSTGDGRDGWPQKKRTRLFSLMPTILLGDPGRPSGPVTLTAHFMTSAVSSDTTRSTHLRLGSFSLRICFLTIASKARSGVKSPVLGTLRSRRGGVGVCFCRSGRQAETEGRAEIRRRRGKRGQPGRKEGKREGRGRGERGRSSVSGFETRKKIQPEDKPQVSHPLFQQASSSTVN